jgi:hypothetical protein
MLRPKVKGKKQKILSSKSEWNSQTLLYEKEKVTTKSAWSGSSLYFQHR